MLLRRPVLEKIVTGEVDLVFRRWRRPTVKQGGTLRTPLGLVFIESVTPIDIGAITEDDARRAGSDLAYILGFLEARADGTVYRVELGGIEPDPRVALREDDNLGDDDVADLAGRLDHLDRASTRGPWTRDILRLIDSNPHVRAQDLADQLGLEKAAFKTDVRKLMELGLTISDSPGYELSPRGRALLDRLDG